MPNPISGLRQTLAIRKAAAWGAALACGIGHGIYFLSGQAKRDASVESDDSRGRSFTVDGTTGPITGGGTYLFNLRYESLDLLIAAFMGIAGVPTQQAATAAYKNIYKFSPDIYGIFLTVAKSMIAYIEEIPTAKVASLTLSGEVGAKPLQLSVELIGIDREIASAVNTLGSFASVTVPTGGDVLPVMFSHLQFRMNDQGGDALGAGDVIRPNKFTLTLKRNLKGEHTGEFRTSGANPQDLIDEPTNDALPELTLTLEFPVHTATTYLVALGADTRKKMDITATGAVIEGAYNYQHLIQLPHLQLKNVNPTDDKGRIKEPLEFIVHGATAAPTGMAGITDPLWWTVTNKRTTDPLA